MIPRSRTLLWTAAGIMLLAGVPAPALAQGEGPKPLYVGDCKPGQDNYGTISAAVAAAPVGATVYVCPGVYPEQVNIGTAINLQAIASGNSNSAVITIPASGLVENIYTLLPCVAGHSCPVSGYTKNYYGAAQLAVENVAGAVNISGITVDGTGAVTAATGFAGFYFDSSSVAAEGIEARNTSADYVQGDGIFSSDNYTTQPTVTVKNSYIYGFNNYGILSSVALVATGNTFTSSSTAIPGVGGCSGIRVENAAATVTSNVIQGKSVGLCSFSGITVAAPSGSTTIGGNKVFGAEIGINVYSSAENPGEVVVPVSVSGNRITLASVFEEGGDVTYYGMALLAEEFDIAGNVINGVNEANIISVGIAACNAVPSTFSGQNTFRGTSIALVLPSGMSLGTQQVYKDIPTIEQSCN
jgi:hypothetical protein